MKNVITGQRRVIRGRLAEPHGRTHLQTEPLDELISHHGTIL